MTDGLQNKMDYGQEWSCAEHPRREPEKNKRPACLHLIVMFCIKQGLAISPCLIYNPNIISEKSDSIPTVTISMK